MVFEKNSLKLQFAPITENKVFQDQSCIPFDQSGFFDRKLDISFHFTERSTPRGRSFRLFAPLIDQILDCLITWTADQKSQGNLDPGTSVWKQIRFRFLCSSWSVIWSNFRLKNLDSDWPKGMQIYEVELSWAAMTQWFCNRHSALSRNEDFVCYEIREHVTCSYNLEIIRTDVTICHIKEIICARQ